MTKNASTANGDARSDAPATCNWPLPKSPLRKRSTTAAISAPNPKPSAEPIIPKCDAFAQQRPFQLPAGDAERARSSASERRRRNTDNDCVENTRKAPVNKATSASMLRFTR